MRRLNVTLAMRRQLDELHDAKTNKRRGGVMVVPRMLSIEEWETAALAAQTALIEEARDELHGMAAVTRGASRLIL